jgi:hypothetical protein
MPLPDVEVCQIHGLAAVQMPANSVKIGMPLLILLPLLLIRLLRD